MNSILWYLNTFFVLDIYVLLQKPQKQSNYWIHLLCNSKRRIQQVRLVTCELHTVLLFFLLTSLFLAAAPDFSKNPVKKMSVVQVGGEVTIGCKPSASPRAVINWRKGSEVLRQNKRYRHKPVAGLLGVLCFNNIF